MHHRVAPEEGLGAKGIRGINGTDKYLFNRRATITSAGRQRAMAAGGIGSRPLYEILMHSQRSPHIHTSTHPHLLQMQSRGVVTSARCVLAPPHPHTAHSPPHAHTLIHPIHTCCRYTAEVLQRPRGACGRRHPSSTPRGRRSRGRGQPGGTRAPGWTCEGG